VKPANIVLSFTAFTIGLVLGNRTGRQALLGEMVEAFPEFFGNHRSESNGDAVVRLRGDCG
jgi:hypothetical protein